MSSWDYGTSSPGLVLYLLIDLTFDLYWSGFMGIYSIIWCLILSGFIAHIVSSLHALDFVFLCSLLWTCMFRTSFCYPNILGSTYRVPGQAWKPSSFPRSLCSFNWKMMWELRTSDTGVRKFKLFLIVIFIYFRKLKLFCIIKTFCFKSSNVQKATSLVKSQPMLNIQPLFQSKCFTCTSCFYTP